MPRFAIWMLLLAVIKATAADTNQQPFCCRYPIRGFGAANVNLAPLFSWWSVGQTGTAGREANDTHRPMKAWNRIVGTKTGEFEYQWVVDAEIFTNRMHSIKTRIILQNPPVQDEQRYETLKQQIAAYDAQIISAQHAVEADLKAEQSARDRADASARLWSLQARVNRDNYNRQAAQKKELAAQAKVEETEAKQSLEILKKELAAIPAEQGHYQIDFFALDTGKTFRDLPVYNAGLIYMPAP